MCNLLPVKQTGSGGRLVKLTLLDVVHHKRRLKVNFKGDKPLDKAVKFGIKVNNQVRLHVMLNSYRIIKLIPDR